VSLKQAVNDKGREELGLPLADEPNAGLTALIGNLTEVTRLGYSALLGCRMSEGKVAIPRLKTFCA